jgi:uncharacterized protein
VSEAEPNKGLVPFKPVLLEIVLLWLGTMLAIRVVVQLVTGLGLHELFLAAVPILFMYAPVALCRYRGVDSYSYPLALPRLRDWPEWREALLLNAAVIGVIVVPWLVGYHFYQTLLFGYELQWTWPSDPMKVVGYHLFFVAIPEEFFYRGYMQSRLDEALGPRWNVLGARLGFGWLLTCVFFAFGHSLVLFQWWHFAIFFPSLVFGWMRVRTGGVMAGAFFHAWSNVTVSTLDTLYGIVPP